MKKRNILMFYGMEYFQTTFYFTFAVLFKSIEFRVTERENTEFSVCVVRLNICNFKTNIKCAPFFDMLNETRVRHNLLGRQIHAKCELSQ